MLQSYLRDMGTQTPPCDAGATYREELAGRRGAIQLVHSVYQPKLRGTERPLVEHSLTESKKPDKHPTDGIKPKSGIQQKHF